jgi:drug/metabolite transporter superfamily protein YnfA
VNEPRPLLAFNAVACLTIGTWHLWEWYREGARKDLFFGAVLILCVPICVLQWLKARQPVEKRD